MSSPETPREPDDVSRQIEASLASMERHVDLEAALNRKEGEPPTFVRGRVAGVSGRDVIIELTPHDQGIIPIAEFGDAAPRLGEIFDFVVTGKDNDLWVVSRREARELASWKEMEKGKVVSARVAGQNTGGLELKVGPIDAFMPASQVALVRVDDLSRFIGETMICEVLEIDRRRKRVTLSRRTILEREAREKRSEVVATIQRGHVVSGTITRLEDFGAFVELKPGVEGLLHVSNISRARINHPSERLKVGQKVEVAVLEIEQGGKRIGLGLKQLEPDPWDDITDRYRPDAVLTGKVARVAAFGAFVTLEPGVDGLVHVSQIGGERGRPVADYAKIGESMLVRVVSIDTDAQRIALSRLDVDGKVLGAQSEAADKDDMEQIRGEIRPAARGGVNLGDLLRKALGD